MAPKRKADAIEGNATGRPKKQAKAGTQEEQVQVDLHVDNAQEEVVIEDDDDDEDEDDDIDDVERLQEEANLLKKRIAQAKKAKAAKAKAAKASGDKPKRQRRKKNDPEPDYTQRILDQIGKSKRTGQACNRCRCRKLRCDKNPQGCLNCIVRGCRCEMVNKVTGEVIERWEVHRLRQENSRLREERDLYREMVKTLGGPPVIYIDSPVLKEMALGDREHDGLGIIKPDMRADEEPEEIEQPEPNSEEQAPKAPGMGKQYDEYVKNLLALRSIQQEDNPLNPEFLRYILRQDGHALFIDSIVAKQREIDQIAEELERQQELAREQAEQAAEAAAEAAAADPTAPPNAPPNGPLNGGPGGPQAPYGYQPPQNPQFPQYPQNQYPHYPQQTVAPQRTQHQPEMLLQQEWTPLVQYQQPPHHYPQPPQGTGQAPPPPQAKYGHRSQPSGDISMTDLLNMGYSQDINEADDFIFPDDTTNGNN